MKCGARCERLTRLAVVRRGPNPAAPGPIAPPQLLEDTRVVTLNGARQAGKSTLARLAAQGRPNSLIRLLDDPAALRAAQDDPVGFVDHDGLLVAPPPCASATTSNAPSAEATRKRSSGHHAAVPPSSTRT
jgi:hypothetical protein